MIDRPSLHFCFLSRECWSEGAPVWRIHLSTHTYNIGMALTPGDRFASIDRLRWISVHKKDRRRP